jgi:hypothetical protein
VVKSTQHRWCLAEAEVGAPSIEVARQLFDDLREAAASGSTRQFPYSRFESGHRRRRQASLDGCSRRKAEAEELPRPRRGDRALRLVDLELETLGEELLDACQARFPSGDLFGYCAGRFHSLVSKAIKQKIRS